MTIEAQIREMVASLVRDEVRRALSQMSPDDRPLPPVREDYLTTKQAAKLLALSVPTLEHMRQEGRGPAFTKAGRRVLYPRSAVDAWLAEREVRR